MHKTYIRIAGLSLGVLSLVSVAISANAQTPTTTQALIPVSPQALQQLNNLPSVEISNLVLNKTSYNPGNTVTGSFVVKNNRAVGISDLKYTVAVVSFDKETGLASQLFDLKSFEPLALNGNERKLVNFSYNIPATILGGDLGIQVRVLTNAGMSLGWADANVTISGASQSLDIKQAYVQVDTLKFGLGEGPTIYATSTASLKVDVYNPSSATISGTPLIKIYDRSISGKEISSSKLGLVSIKSKQTQSLSVDLKKVGNTPGVFEGSFVLVGDKNAQETNIVNFRYIVAGDIVTIHRVTPDRYSGGIGDTVNVKIDYSGMPFDVATGGVAKMDPLSTTVTILNQNNDLVSRYVGLVDYSADISTVIPMKLTAAASSFKIGIEVVDSRGNSVASYSSSFEGMSNNAVFSSGGVSLSDWSGVIALAIIVLLIIILVIVKMVHSRLAIKK